MPREFRVDTHAVIIQASCVKLVQMLMKNYPNIERLQSTSQSPAQGSLIYYLGTFITPQKQKEETEYHIAKTSTSIAATVAMVDIINELPDKVLSSENKVRIFKQMQFISNSYPGGDWSDAKAQWSINQFFNPDTQETEMCMTPPAEALNLVCKALLDNSHYSASDDKSEAEKIERVNNFYNLLLELQKQVEQGQLEKCSAGLQHDLLYLLDHGYLDEGHQPIHLLMDNVAFLQESLVNFIENQMQSHKGSETDQMLLDWMRWKMDPSPVSECPLIVWLRSLYPSQEKVDQCWKQACKDYLTRRCEQFFLNPKQSPLDEYINQIADSPIPTSENAITSLISEIMRMGNLRINSGSPMVSLIVSRNQALIQFKERINLVDWRTHALQIQEFFSVLEACASLYHYRDLTLLLGEEDAVFSQTRQEMTHFLSNYFLNYDLDKKMREEELSSFENLKARYLKQERNFLKQSNADFVANFFNIAAFQGFQATWERLITLNPGNLAIHPLVLSDDLIKKWCEEEVASDGVLNVTPYAANRLILHGFMQPVSTWTPLYCHYLITLIRWLATPSQEDEALNLRSFKQSYSPILLSNLMFMALIQNATMEENLKQRLTELPDQSAHFMMTRLVMCLYHPSFTPEQSAEILNAIVGNIDCLILTGGELVYLFSLPSERLDGMQRTQILNVLTQSGKLRTLFENGEQLYNLFSLLPTQLDTLQRTQILNSIQDQLKILIQTYDQFMELFRLSLEQLNSPQRKQILLLLGQQCVDFFQTYEQLESVLNLSRERLNRGQRNWLLKGIIGGGRIGVLIQTSAQLRKLFRLSSQELDTEQRTLILDGMKGQLGTLIQTSEQFMEVFKLSINELDMEQRRLLFSSVYQLKGLVKNFYELMQLFELSPEQLDMNQRTQLISSKLDEIGDWIKTGNQLMSVFGLSVQHLDSTQRRQIFKMLEGRLESLIETFNQFRYLFALSPNQLNKEQRGTVWNSIKKHIDTLIQNPRQLELILQLSMDQLNSEQRREILGALKNKLKSWFSTTYSRKYLSEAFPPEERKLIETILEEGNFSFNSRFFSSSNSEPATRDVNDSSLKTKLQSKD